MAHPGFLCAAVSLILIIGAGRGMERLLGEMELGAARTELTVKLRGHVNARVRRRVAGVLGGGASKWLPGKGR